MKLWKKGYDINKKIEKFTVGKDYILDKKLVKFDCLASIAHAKMLNKIEVLDDKELEDLILSLNEIIELSKENKFEIKLEDEDCHTAIENYLVSKLGEVGKKIHTARSRNDQVLTCLKLYEKSELEEIKQLLFYYQNSFDDVIKKYGEVKMPGYTHMQKAMPTDIKTWLGCFKDSVNDNFIILDSVMKLVDQSPLGSAASFGVPVFDIDKNMTAKEMNFSKVMENPMLCQMTRGKHESVFVNLLTQIMYDLNKLATDLVLFNMKEFQYVSLPVDFCTGSSIMPQKKNPDVLELIKASYSIVLGEEFKIKSLVSNLMSGYNRDLQLTKEPLFNSIEITKDCIEILTLVINELKINEEKCSLAMTEELYATEEAYKLVKEGMSFREAYKKVGEKYVS